MKARQNYITLQTQEGIHFSLPLASPVLRLLALMIDLTLLVCLLMLLSLVGYLLLFIILSVSKTLADLWMAIAILCSFMLWFGYFMIAEWRGQGQTLGKRILRLKVMDMRALKLQPNQIIVRNLLRVIDSIPLLYFVGGVSSLLNTHYQRLGDLAAGTVVVRLPQHKQPEFHDTLGGKYNSLRDHPHLEALLRQRCGPEETQIAYQAILRRDQLDPIARTQLFSALADHFKQRVAFPENATFGLSDEQYVRNCMDSIYRKRLS